MKDHPIFRYWKLFIAFPMFLGFAGYNVYCAYAYGEIIGSQYGNGWITFHARPYMFSFALIVYILMLAIFGAALVKIAQFLVMTLFARPETYAALPTAPSTAQGGVRGKLRR